MANTKTISKIKDFIVTAQKQLPENAFNKTVSVLNQKSALQNYTIPIMTTDEDVIDFIKEYELNKPENLIRFFVELYFENLEYIADSFNELKYIDLDEAIAHIESARNTYDMSKGTDEEARKNNHISKAQSELNTAISELNKKIRHYIKEQRKIDGMNRFKRALKSRQIIKDIDANNNLAKEGFKALMAAVSLQIAIANEVGDDIQHSSFITSYELFKKEILSGDMCIFMHGYDVDYSDGFWLTLPDAMNTVNRAAEITVELTDDDDIDDDIDYENIDF